MRAPVLVVLVGLAATAARADMMPLPPPPEPPPDFWARVLDPRPPATLELSTQLGSALRVLDEPWGAVDGTRVELIRRGAQASRYLLAQAPTSGVALYYAGAFAELAGQTAEAERWLTAALAAPSFDGDRADARYRLAMLRLRRGRADDALVLLRGLGRDVDDRGAQVRVAIATAYAFEALGDLPAAVGTLEPITTSGDDVATIAAAIHLTALYDRDEQITAAFELLLRLRQTTEGELLGYGDNALRGFPPPRAIDRVYIRALLAEASPSFAERDAARLWLQVEQSGATAATAARAHAHRVALERQLAQARRPRPPRTR